MHDGAIHMDSCAEAHAGDLAFGCKSSLVSTGGVARLLRSRPPLTAVRRGDSLPFFGPTVSVPTLLRIKPSATLETRGRRHQTTDR